MDPITAAAIGAVLVPLANGAAGEAGKQVLNRLVSFLGARFGRGSDAEVAGRALASAPDQVDLVPSLAHELERSAEADETVAAWLRAWLQEAGPIVGSSPGSVSNVIGGDARVSGGSLQAQYVSGTVNFGSSTPDGVA